MRREGRLGRRSLGDREEADVDDNLDESAET
jgi:hypothetical protein